MSENLTRFMKEISSNEELRKAVIELNKNYTDKDENLKQLIELASAHGFALSADDFSAGKQEINEEDLDNIAGGEIFTDDFGRKRSKCGCWAFGGGASDEYQYDCGCIAGGVGSFTEEGHRLVKEGEIYQPGAAGAPVPMWCALIGAGDVV